MARLALTLARFCFSAWVGAAALFVINGVQQVTFPGFDTTIRSQLALLRFPAYYAMGFGLVGTGLVGTSLAGTSPDFPRSRRTAALLLSVAALAVMLGDYWSVYRPLAAMLTPPDAARPAGFQTYHHLSEAINTLHVGLVLSAALVVSWPPRAASSAA